MRGRFATRGLVIGTLCVSLPLGGSVSAQSSIEPTLTGRVVGPDSQPVAGATVRVIQGTASHVVRTNDVGRYRIIPMTDGIWTVAVQALGYVALFERMTYSGPTMERDFHLKRVQTELAPVFVEGDWSGVRGFVVDERGFAPLDGARIEVLSKGGAVLATDTSGRFTVEQPDGSDVRLLVERAGYARRVVMAKATRLAAERLVIRLDTLWDPINNGMEWADLRSRIRQASPRAAFVSGDEIRAAGGISAAPTLTRKGVQAGGCLLVNGIARPSGFWFDLKEIDFIEVYPPGSEHSGTLAMRSGSMQGCGFDWAGASASPSRAAYIVIWLKTPPPPPPPPR